MEGLKKKFKMDLEKYYKGNHEYEFLVNAWNLYSQSEINEFLSKYNFEDEKDIGKKRKILHDLRAKFDLDEFNFSMIIRLSLVLELSLKGIAIYKKINIFTENDKRTLGLNYFINNLFSLLNFNDCSKYKPMLQFFQTKRNAYVHFSKKSYNINYIEINKNLILLKKFMERIVVPLKDKVCEENLK